ncbi:MAG TPA: phosphatase PAP2 family protein [Candidatus Polarisedimenticolaceae bacterium]|nr:phosphatase PAP2 family protein [Candidatus Polarisedimenticolaceae bacterium]
MRVRSGLLAALLAIAAAVPAVAADPVQEADRPYWRTNLFKRFAYDQKFLFKEWLPNEVRRPQFYAPILAGLFLGANSKGNGGGLDPTRQSDFASDRSAWQISASHDLTTFGNAPVVAAMLGVTYLASRKAGNDDLASAASLSSEAILDVGLWTIVIKEVAARTRPGPQSTGAFFQWGKPRSGSFPSGHAAVAFSVATVFAEQYHDTHKWVPWVAYSTATLIGLARIAVGQHYPSDVLVGATLGHSMGEMVMARDGAQRDDWYRHLTPVYDPATQGWGVGYERQW